MDADFPLLTKAASWIGSIANQSRATLGGNLVNGSPAADSSPALLAYDAEVEMISVRGRRRVAYAEFHTGYKRNTLAPDELLFAIHVPRRFATHRQYLRKVGTRRAMAIAKVALGATARMEHEAATSKIGEDQLFYLRQRGLKTEDAVSMIVNGFCKRVFRELPMEFAVEAQKLLSVSLEGSVG